MIKIWTKNVYSQLSNYTEELERRLTVFYPNYWFMPQVRAGLADGKYHFLKQPSLKFPTGLLFIVEEYFKETETAYEIIDEREIPNIGVVYQAPFDSILNDIVLRDYQMEAIDRAIKKERGILEMPTGSGKTEVAAGIIKLLDLRTLFMVHTKDLLYQTAQRFEERLGKKTGIIGDGKWDEAEVVIATVQTLDRALRKDQGNMKKFLNSFPIIFQDECHHTSAISWYKLGMFCHGAYYRFGLSGTALRRDVLSNMRIMAVMGAPIFQQETTDLIEQGYLSEIEVRIIDNPEIVYGENWQEIYRNGIVNSPKRNGVIADVAKMHFAEGKRVMILVRQIQQGEDLKQLLATNGCSVEFLWGYHKSEEREKAKKLFHEKGNFVLVASPIYDEGVDLPEVNVLMIGSGLKSEWKTIQKVGRGLRKTKSGEPLIVYDFYDHSEYLEKHSEARVGIYKKEGFLENEQERFEPALA